MCVEFSVSTDESSLAASATSPSLDAAAAQLDQAIARATATREQQGEGYEPVGHASQTQVESRQHLPAGAVSDPTARSKPSAVSASSAGFSDSESTAYF